MKEVKKNQPEKKKIDLHITVALCRWWAAFTRRWCWNYQSRVVWAFRYIIYVTFCIQTATWSHRYKKKEKIIANTTIILAIVLRLHKNPSRTSTTTTYFISSLSFVSFPIPQSKFVPTLYFML